MKNKKMVTIKKKGIASWSYHKLKFNDNIISQKLFEDRFYNHCGEEINIQILVAYICKYHKNISLVVLDGTGGIITKVAATNRNNHLTLGAVCSNNHLNPTDNELVIKQMMKNTFNDKNVCDLLEIF